MPGESSILFTLSFISLVVALTALGRRLPIPPPILQVGAGALVALLPGVRVPEVDPELVFFVFLPPVLWAAAFFTSWRDFTANRRPIGLLAVGLVVATTGAVALVARSLFPGMPWAVAVALGAIVSPPDAVAATAIVSRLPVPRRVIVILEGESLVNDASALILYRSAVAAAVTGIFSLGESVVRFFVDAAVGVLIGLVVGWLVVRALAWSRDVMAETLVTLAAPYAAWIAAESLHVSAVLACVAGGLYVRRHFSAAVSPLSRLQNRSVWDLLVFVLNAAIFVLLGAQGRSLLGEAPEGTLGHLLLAGTIVALVVIVVRLVWVPLATVAPRLLARDVRRRDPLPPFRSMFLVAWTSMRGIVSLATALALPVTLASGAPFPFRREILVITMCVIVLTLVVQGLTLSPIIRAFRFAPEAHHHAEAHMARLEAARRGAETLEDLSREDWVDARDVARLRNELRDRIATLQSHDGATDGERRLRSAMLRAERRMLVRLRNEGAISDEVLLELEQLLDLEAVRVGAGESVKRTRSRRRIPVSAARGNPTQGMPAHDPRPPSASARRFRAFTFRSRRFLPNRAFRPRARCRPARRWAYTIHSANPMTIHVQPLLIGLGLALAVGAGATVLRFDRDRSFYPVTLIVIASLYVLFATLGSGEAVGAELVPATAFVLAAGVGFRRNLWLVAAALAGHGVFDAVHGHVIDNDGVPAWWPSFCGAYDIAAGVYMAWRLRNGLPATTRVPRFSPSIQGRGDRVA